MRPHRAVATFAAIALVSIPLTRAQTTPAFADISVDDLRSKLGVIADDSMLGRMTGTQSAERASAYIVGELTRAGVKPAGDSATYFQSVPIVRKRLDLEHARSGDNGGYMPGIDFIPLVGVFGLGTPDSALVRERPYVPAGQLGAADAIAPEKVNGQFPVFLAPRRANGQSEYQLWGFRDVLTRYRQAGAIFIASLDLVPRALRRAATLPRLDLRERFATVPPLPPVILFTRGASRKAIGSVNQSVSYRTLQTSLDVQARNVVAVVEGSDPMYKDEYVVLSAHLDHRGIAAEDEQEGSDSVYNGASAGTGAVGLLEIARHFAALPVKPKRSLVFVWTVGSAQGLLGTEFFVDNPTVPRERIVANIAVADIGRGGERDVSGGGAQYVEAHGARRLSAELGELIAAVGRRPEFGLSVQAPTAESGNLPGAVCRGDEWHFARRGIPSVRVTTGSHPDSNGLDDEVGVVDFDKAVRAARFVAAIADAVANRASKFAIDKALPDPRSLCVQ